jgi:hypothetical protein
MQSEHRHIQRQRDPGQRVVIGLIETAESVQECVRVQADVDVGIFRDISLVVVVDEIEAGRSTDSASPAMITVPAPTFT